MAMKRFTTGGLFGAIACALSLGACAAQPGEAQATRAQTQAEAPAPTSADLIENGRVIAETECARCHAVGAEGESAHAGAPPLRHVLQRYRADSLAEDLNEGIRVGHADMPEFELPLQGVDSLIAYLQSIQTTGAE